MQSTCLERKRHLVALSNIWFDMFFRRAPNDNRMCRSVERQMTVHREAEKELQSQIDSLQDQLQAAHDQADRKQTVMDNLSEVGDASYKGDPLSHVPSDMFSRLSPSQIMMALMWASCYSESRDSLQYELGIWLSLSPITPANLLYIGWNDFSASGQTI